MSDLNNSCHGVLECLHRGSGRWILGRLASLYQRPRSYAVWCLENLGWRAGLRQSLGLPFRRSSLPGKACPPADGEGLGLEPGELVEVRSVEEILATLDGHRRHKGLLWMTGMRKYCGARLRVYRRVERIMLESNGQLRNMKNTVLLEGAMCDGREFGRCDRSCFHFWREAWLKRVQVQGQDSGPDVSWSRPDVKERESEWRSGKG